MRLRVDDPTGHSYGTGTIIDARSGEALVITCGHLFRDSKGKGPVMVEMFEATPDGVRVVGQVAGQVISYNSTATSPWSAFGRTCRVRVAPIASVANDRRSRPPRDRRRLQPRQGSDGGVDARDDVNRYQGTPNIEMSGAPVEGRSGGGLFDSEGRLVGICFAADYEGNEGLYTALDSIHDELDRLGLSDIYHSAAATVPQSRRVASQPPATTATPTVVRGQEPSPAGDADRDGSRSVPAAFAASVARAIRRQPSRPA